VLAGFWRGNLKQRKPLGSHRNKWEDNIKMNLKGRGWEGVEWIHLAQSRDKCQVLLNTLISVP
jgi:hypothetical protein